MNEIDAVRQFMEKAKKLNKYGSSNHASLLSAFRMATDNLVQEEPRDLTYLDSHLHEIIMRSGKLSEPSIRTYVARVKKVISDFKSHGGSDKALFDWKPEIRARKTPRSVIQAGQTDTPHGTHAEVTMEPSVRPIALDANFHALRLSLRDGVFAEIRVPADLKKEEAERISALLKSISL